jgi:hypothetical protein
MPMFSRLAKTKCMLLLAMATAVFADSESSTVVRFLPDDALPQDVLGSFLEARHVGEYRVVEFDSDALRQALREAYPPSSASKSPTITLPLIDGALVTIELRGGGEEHDGWQAGFATFMGKVAGDEYSWIICVVSPDGSASLTMSTAGKRFKLEKTSLLPYHVYWSLGKGSSQKID